MRLQKYLAECGIASRRKCETLIIEGHISVNGEIVQTLGTKVSSEDEVRYNNQVVVPNQKEVYYMLNKPVGYVTTVQDEKNRPTVIDLLNDVNERIFPIGRLDYLTSGLLILTNDGALTYGLTHPKHHVGKTYEAKIKGKISDHELEQLRQGVLIDGRMTYPAKVSLIKRNEKWSLIKLTIHEGRNRQIRKMCEYVGHFVMELKRTSIGKLTLGDLKEGQYRSLNEQEIIYLKQLTEDV